MTDTPVELPAKPKKKPIGCLIFVGLVLALIPASIAAYAIYAHYGQKAFDQARARAIRTGMPGALAQVTPKPVPHDQNAVSVLLDHFKTVEYYFGVPNEDLLEFGEIFLTYMPDPHLDPVSDLSPDQCRALLGKLSERPFVDTFDTATAMLQKPNYWPGNDWGETFAMRTPDMTLVSCLVRLHALRARANARLGNNADACRDITTIYRLNALVQQTKTLRILNKVMHWDAYATTTLNVCLSESPKDFTAEQLTTMISEIQRRRHPLDNAELVRIIDAEYIFYVHELDQVDQRGTLFYNRLQGESGDRFPHRLIVLAKPIWLYDSSQAIDQIIAMRQQATRPHHQAPAFTSDDSFSLTITGMFSRRVLSSIHSMTYRFTLHECRLATAEAGLRVLLWQQEHGTYPTADDIPTIADWPQDAFSASPINYAQSDDGYRVWFNPPIRRPQKQQERETVWQYPRPSN